MNAIYGMAARLCSVARQVKKNAIPGRSEVWLPKMPKCGPRGAPQVARMLRSTRLLHIDEEVALQNVLAFFVLLGLFVRLVL